MRDNSEKMPPVVILCGGKGTRLREVTELLPKPMVPIGNEPILLHIMRTYASFGCTRFILCLGYMKEKFSEYFKFHDPVKLGWEVSLLDTGEETATGGRVYQAAKTLRPDDEDFFLTYGDGVADVDIGKSFRRHRSADRLITVTAVHPASRFGEMVIRGDQIVQFSEKPAVSRFYINGGFMVVSKGFVRSYLTKSKTMFFEQRPMNRAAADGQMTVYRHEGFWQCMDTPREYELLNRLWKQGKAPWKKIWK